LASHARIGNLEGDRDEERVEMEGPAAVLQLEEERLRRRATQKLSLECSACGYGASRAEPPERCPMCRREGTWVHTPWRPFGRVTEAP
jgi:rubrerythrin